MEVANTCVRPSLPTDSHDRRRMLRHLVGVITDDDAAYLDELLLQRKARYDILGNLPTELVLRVLDHLALRDLHLYAQVCQRWRHLSRARDVVDRLHSKWLPLHDKTSSKQFRDLALTAAKAYLRTTGRFPLRISTTFHNVWHAQDGDLPLRLQVLQPTHTYSDVVCSGSGNVEPEVTPLTDFNTITSILFAFGVLAWVPLGHAQAICIHNVRQNNRKKCTAPSHFLVQGDMLKLLALGNKLVVAACSRTM